MAPEAPVLTRGWTLHRERRYGDLEALLRPLAPEALQAEPALGFLLADVQRRLGHGPGAFQILKGLAPAFDRQGNDRVHRRRLNLLGTLHFEQGRNEEARRVWARQLDDATAAGDEEFVARANNNLGILATLATDWAQAVFHYGRAVAAYHRLGYTRGLAQSHHNLGLTYRAMDRPALAAEHFDRALAYADVDSPDEVARSELEHALLRLYAGDLALARARADRALDRYLSFGDLTGEGEALRVLGLVSLASADLDEARRHLDQSARIAGQVDAPLLSAEVLEAVAALCEADGDDAATARASDEARAVFRRLGAEQWGRHIRRRSRQVAGLAPEPAPEPPA